jgi:hypothetical protein
MQVTITMIDYAPPDLEEQLPIVVDLLRELPGDDQPDYWLAATATPIRWLQDNHTRVITHLVLAARWQGTRIEAGVANLPIGIAYVLDASSLADTHLDLTKCKYVAIGLASDTTGGEPPPGPTAIQAGHIAPGFGTGQSS